MWKVEHRGAEIDIDPLTLDMADFEAIEQRSGISGLKDLMQQMAAFKPTAWKALYWAGARRSGADPGQFSDFGGPTYDAILRQGARLKEFVAQVGVLLDLGKAPDPSPPDNAG